MTMLTPMPEDEASRLSRLRSLAVLDTPPEAIFDALARAASEACGVPVALLSLVDSDRQWFKANVGWAGTTETARAVALCAHTILGPDLMEVEDATRDVRFMDNPLVTGRAGIRFYAGAPIALSDGARVGALCVLDQTPRQLSDRQRNVLQHLATAAAQALEFRERGLRAMTALGESESRYRMVVEHQTEMVSLADRSGQLTFVNEAYARQFGRSAGDMVGTSLFDYVAPDDQDAVRRYLTALWESGGTARGENHMLSADGRGPRWVAWTNRALRDPGGAVVALHSVGRDITAQKNAECALQRLNAEQKTILDSELLGIAKLRDRRFIWANAGLAKSLGYLPGELVGLPTRLGHIDDVAYERFGASADQALQRGETFRDEVPMRRKDGTLIWVELTGTLLDAQTGESLWLFSDISSRKLAELALHSSRAVLERTGAMAGVGGWELDLASGELLWTAETCRIHGVPMDFRPDARLALSFYLPEDRPIIQAAVDTALNGGPAYDLELQLQRADGVQIWVRTVGTVEGHDGKPSKLVGAIQDVTAKVEQLRHIEHLYDIAEAQRRELEGHRDRADAEAEVARFLLSRLSRIEQLDATGVQYYWKPAESFSGDIIAVAKSSSGDTYGMLADATGHGLAAAINLIPLTAAFYSMAEKGFTLTAISQELNGVVKEYSLADRFVAVTLARLVHRGHLLEVVNAGNPAALLLDAQLNVQREFRSSSIPLGIVGPHAFRPVLEVVELRGDETLLMFSDGLIEANDPAGQPFGREGVQAALASAGAGGQLVMSIRERVVSHGAGAPFADDVSVLALPAIDPMLGELAGSSREEASDPARSHNVPGDQDPDAETAGRWSLDLRFSARELKKLEVVPLVVDLARNFGLHGPVTAVVFTVISELFQNALEHGLLGLDSRTKAGTDGFERYLELREQRLAALRHGEIAVRIEHVATGTETGRLTISVLDTGPGFDHQAQFRRLNDDVHPGATLLPSGRGLTMLRRLCDEVSFNAKGNEGRIELSY